MSTEPAICILYDDVLRIGFAQLEKIVQALVWLGDIVILPSRITPDPRLGEGHARFIRQRLAAFAEVGYVILWDLDGPDARPPPRWLPKSTEQDLVPVEAYSEVMAIVDEATRTYRRDILRGVGKPAGVGLDGITEFVMLRSAVYAHGIADVLGADHLLQLPQRSPAAPLRKVALARRIDPVARALMDVHRVAPLWHLEPQDIQRLRARLPAARAFVTKIAEHGPSEIVYRDEQELIADLQKEALASYVEIIRPRDSELVRGAALTWTVGILGMLYPVLSALSFGQPLLEWRLRERSARRVATFMTQLSSTAAKAERRALPPR